MKFNGISISANVPIFAAPNFDGRGEAITIEIQPGIRILVVARCVAMPFWALQFEDDMTLTGWISFVSGFFGESVTYTDPRFQIEVSGAEIELTISESEPDTELPEDPEEDVCIEEMPAE